MNYKAFFNTLTNRCRTLPIVILYVTEGCNMRCTMCSYREPLSNELTLNEIVTIAEQLNNMGLQHIVYSGGEPLLRKDFPVICKTFSSCGVRQTLLTNGLLLQKRFSEIKNTLSEIIISLDGSTAEVHNAIRGVESFALIMQGIHYILRSTEKPRVSLRTVLQKENFRQLPQLIELGKSLGVNRVSFLAVDVRSQAFGRTLKEEILPLDSLILNEKECQEFRIIIQDVIKSYHSEFKSGFISDTPERLFHILQYFQALIGKAELPRNYCNAPNVSAVITARGDLLPCFFLPPYGNIKTMNISEYLNDKIIRKVRQDVKKYSLHECKSCVCTLSVRPFAALMNYF